MSSGFLRARRSRLALHRVFILRIAADVIAIGNHFAGCHQSGHIDGDWPVGTADIQHGVGSLQEGTDVLLVRGAPIDGRDGRGRRVETRI